MKRITLALFIFAASAFAQIETPGVFGLLQSQMVSETLPIPMRDVANFSYIPYISLDFRHSPDSLVNACQVWVETPLLISDGPRIWLTTADMTDWMGPYKLGSTAIDPATGAVVDRKLSNGVCTVNVTRSSLVPDLLRITDGKLELWMEYLGDIPGYLYAITQPLSTLKLSLARLRPICPLHAPDGQWPETGCQQ